MAQYTATFPGYANGRVSRYAGWADVEISPGAVITVTADDRATVTIGEQRLTVASPDPSGGSGYQPGTGSLMYSGNGGRVTVTFTAWSAGGEGYVTISGFDTVHGGAWIQTYLEGEEGEEGGGDGLIQRPHTEQTRIETVWTREDPVSITPAHARLKSATTPATFTARQVHWHKQRVWVRTRMDTYDANGNVIAYGDWDDPAGVAQPFGPEQAEVITDSVTVDAGSFGNGNVLTFTLPACPCAQSGCIGGRTAWTITYTPPPGGASGGSSGGNTGGGSGGGILPGSGGGTLTPAPGGGTGNGNGGGEGGEGGGSVTAGAWTVGIPATIEVPADGTTPAIGAFPEGASVFGPISYNGDPSWLDWPEGVKFDPDVSSTGFFAKEIVFGGLHAPEYRYFEIAVEENPNTTERSCAVTWTAKNPKESGTHVIRQAGAVFDPNKTFYIEPAALEFSADAGMQRVTLCNADKHGGVMRCGGSEDWVSITASGRVSVEENTTGAPRTAVVTWTCNDTARAQLTVIQGTEITGDNGDTNPSPQPQLYLKIKHIDGTPSAAAGTLTCEISTTADWWTATGDSEWLSISPDAGGDRVTATLALEENTTGAARDGTITFYGEHGVRLAALTITQPGEASTEPPPLFSVTPVLHEADWTGGAFALAVSSNTAWTATAPEWVSLDGRAGSGSVDLTATVAANDAATGRSGAIVFSYGDGQTARAEITQSGRPSGNPVPEVTVFPNYETATAAGGRSIITLTANCAWRLEGAEDWISVGQRSGGAGTVDLYVEYEENTDAEARIAILEFLTPNEDVDGEPAAISALWTLFQEGTKSEEPPPTLPEKTLSATLDAEKFPFGGGTAELVATFSGYTADDVALTIEGNWIRARITAQTETSKTWTLTVDGNAGGEWRKAMLTAWTEEHDTVFRIEQVGGGKALRAIGPRVSGKFFK